MRQSRIIVGGLIGIALSSCAITSPYANTVAKLHESLYRWLPPGSDGSSDPRPDVASHIQTDLDGCVDLLQSMRAHYSPKPSAEERVADLVICMKSKGWDLVHDEVVVTG
jgi:hypothetical protein